MKMTFDDFSPFTGNKRILIEPDIDKNDTMKICMDTGYHTYERNWVVGSPVLNIVEANYPLIITETKKEAEGNVWYKLMLMTPFVVLMPEQQGDELVWTIYPLRDGDPEKDTIIMEVEGPSNKIYRALNTAERIEFKELEYEIAMDTFQAMAAEIYRKISEVANSEEE